MTVPKPGSCPSDWLRAAHEEMPSSLDWKLQSKNMLPLTAIGMNTESWGFRHAWVPGPPA